MKRIPFIFAIALLTASAAHADLNDPMLQSVAPVAEPQMQMQTEASPQLQLAEVDKDAQITRLRAQNAQLRQKNEALDQENAELRGRVEAMTSLGGSEVHAYCSDNVTSRNTAGASNDCAATGYTCEPVSGLCRTMVRSSLECAVGFLMCGDRCIPSHSSEVCD